MVLPEDEADAQAVDQFAPTEDQLKAFRAGGVPRREGQRAQHNGECAGQGQIPSHETADVEYSTWSFQENTAVEPARIREAGRSHLRELFSFQREIPAARVPR